MSLNLKTIETPYQAYIRKMPKEEVITDEESGETYHAQKIYKQVYSFRENTGFSFRQSSSPVQDSCDRKAICQTKNSSPIAPL